MPCFFFLVIFHHRLSSEPAKATCCSSSGWQRHGIRGHGDRFLNAAHPRRPYHHRQGPCSTVHSHRASRGLPRCVYRENLASRVQEHFSPKSPVFEVPLHHAHARKRLWRGLDATTSSGLRPRVSLLIARCRPLTPTSSRGRNAGSRRRLPRTFRCLRWTGRLCSRSL